MFTDTDLALVVAKSAKQLDCDMPEWQNKINTDLLDMGEPDFCICGQLELDGPNPDNSNWTGYKGSIYMSKSRGFYVSEFQNDFLKQLWLVEIQQRKV